MDLLKKLEIKKRLITKRNNTPNNGFEKSPSCCSYLASTYLLYLWHLSILFNRFTFIVYNAFIMIPKKGVKIFTSVLNAPIIALAGGHMESHLQDASDCGAYTK